MALINSFKNYFGKKEEKKREEKKEAWQIVAIPMKWDDLKFIHGAIQDILSNCHVPAPEVDNCLLLLRTLADQEESVYDTHRMEIPANMLNGLWQVLNHGRGMGVYTKSPLDAMTLKKGTESQKLEVNKKLEKKKLLDMRLDFVTTDIALALDAYRESKDKGRKIEDLVSLPKGEGNQQLAAPDSTPSS